MRATIEIADPQRHAEQIAAIYAPFVIETPISFETLPPSVDEIRQRITTGLAIYPWLVAKNGNDVVGYCYASAHRTRTSYRWSCDVTVYLAPEARRHGVGSALYSRLSETLKKQGFVNAYAGITLPNGASVGLHEAIGFKPIGIYRNVGFKFGQWHDVGWWGLALQSELNAEPREIIRFSELRHKL